MRKVGLKTIESNDTVTMYSICFEGNAESEFENFMNRFRSESTLNRDFQTIILWCQNNVHLSGR